MRYSRQEIIDLIVQEARRQGVDPILALALAQQESGFNPSATSPTGVVGLFQVTNRTGAAYGQTPETRTDPAVSARAGLSYFRDLLRQTGGDEDAALARYNGGSDPQYVAHVRRHMPVHELGQALYGAPEPRESGAPGASPAPRSLGEALYGPQPPETARPQAAPSLGEALYGPRGAPKGP
jgi:hypothetical protein